MPIQARGLLLSLILLATACGGGGTDGVPRAGPATANTASFVHVVRADNRTGYVTLLDHSISSGNPFAYVIVTTNYVPAAGGFGVLDDHNIGVHYSHAHHTWAIAHLDAAEMPLGAAFSVTLSDAPHAVSATFARFQTGAATLDPTRLVIDDAAVNGNPNAVILVTYNGTPGGEVGGANDHPIGLEYDPGRGRWIVYNRDDGWMSAGTAFNLAFVESGADSPFTSLTTHASSPTSNIDFRTRLAISNEPALIVHASVLFNAPGSPIHVYYARRFGVYHDSTAWSIANQDLVSMGTGVAWNVVVARP